MRRSTLRTAVAVVTAGLTLTACGGRTAAARAAADGSDAATATSAEDVGGMDALVKAAQAEGKLNVIALPPGWANYERDARDLRREVRHQDQQRQPRRLQPGRARRGHQQKGQDRLPTSSTSAPASPAGRRAEPARPRTRSRPGTTSRTTRRTPDGHWYNDYGGFISIGCNTSVVKEGPSTIERVRDEEVEVLAERRASGRTRPARRSAGSSS